MGLTVLTFRNGGIFLIMACSLFWKDSAIGAEGARSPRVCEKDCKMLARAGYDLSFPVVAEQRLCTQIN